MSIYNSIVSIISNCAVFDSYVGGTPQFTDSSSQSPGYHADTLDWTNLGDFHLRSSSPCVNTGNNAYLTWPYPVGLSDLDGSNRKRTLLDTVDIGCYESPF